MKKTLLITLILILIIACSKEVVKETTNGKPQKANPEKILENTIAPGMAIIKAKLISYTKTGENYNGIFNVLEVIKTGMATPKLHNGMELKTYINKEILDKIDLVVEKTYIISVKSASPESNSNWLLVTIKK